MHYKCKLKFAHTFFGTWNGTKQMIARESCLFTDFIISRKAKKLQVILLGILKLQIGCFLICRPRHIDKALNEEKCSNR